MAEEQKLVAPEWIGTTYGYDENDVYQRHPGGNVEEFAAARKNNVPINVLGFFAADESYSFDEAYVIEIGGRFYIAHTSGCSCPSPEDNVACVAGPAATLGGLFDELVVNAAPSSKKYVAETVKLAFVDAIDRMNKETLAATKRALGITDRSPDSE